MRRYTLLLAFWALAIANAHSQSLEVMAGNESVFADAQWLKFMGAQNRWSLFSRTRATVDYDNHTSLFTGTYLNYTTRSGIGLSVVGKIADAGGGADAGVHIFKAKPNWMLFGLASAGLKSHLEYSWFSILRYTPSLGREWKLYTSLELFFLFERGSHLASVQRLRLGMDYRHFQFGIAGNFTELGAGWVTSSNIGAFLRKEF